MFLYDWLKDEDPINAVRSKTSGRPSESLDEEV